MLKTLLSAAALVLAAVTASAQEPRECGSTTPPTCAEGSTWSAEAAACVPVTS